MRHGERQTPEPEIQRESFYQLPSHPEGWKLSPLNTSGAPGKSKVIIDQNVNITPAPIIVVLDHETELRESPYSEGVVKNIIPKGSKVRILSSSNDNDWHRVAVITFNYVVNSRTRSKPNHLRRTVLRRINIRALKMLNGPENNPPPVIYQSSSIKKG